MLITFSNNYVTIIFVININVYKKTRTNQVLLVFSKVAPMSPTKRFISIIVRKMEVSITPSGQR